jgi:hypothetical protein
MKVRGNFFNIHDPMWHVRKYAKIKDMKQSLTLALDLELWNPDVGLALAPCRAQGAPQAAALHSFQITYRFISLKISAP